eukprot:Mrub_01143.p1 GENE.Mrub_01143~~Mrub_01143.p1  ORF type:complete len:778 (+),score=232.21 Mrub_01143:322-2334(+)
MIGNDAEPGVMYLFVEDLFKLCNSKTNFDYQLNVSYVEIYNENIKDLTCVGKTEYLDLREDPDKGISIAGVNLQEVKNTGEIMNILIEGNKRRTTESTNANLTSSRSHAIFQIFTKIVDKKKGTSYDVMESKLSLIDLAGSERGTVTENRGIRLREGAKINRSLLALANCINALGDSNKKGMFIPYRDSKLTRLLKDSLGGKSRTVMMCAVAPASQGFEETINTLKYANRAKEIKIQAGQNKRLVSMHVSEYKLIIDDLRKEIESLRSQVQSGDANTSQSVDESYSKMDTKDMYQEVTKIKNEIASIYEERINIRKAISELHEQNMHNTLEIKYNLANLLMWKKQDINGLEDEDPKNKTIKVIPPEIEDQFKNVALLRKNYEKNYGYRNKLKVELQENFLKVENLKKLIPSRIRSLEFREMLDTMLKNHIIELHNQEMDYQLRKQAKLIEELNEVIVNQKRIMNKHGLKDADMPVIAEDEDYLMEEFDTASRQGQDPFDKNAEEELVEQLEDFETLRENNSDNENDDNDNDFDEEQDEVMDMAEKENDRGKKKILKNPSQRQIYTSDGDRPKDFGIIGKGFNDKADEKINNKKAKDQMSPRGDKRDERRYKRENKAYNNKDKDSRAIKELDPNVMITGNQLRPGEVIGNEKNKKDKNQKSIIGWFYKNKI